MTSTASAPASRSAASFSPPPPWPPTTWARNWWPIPLGILNLPAPDPVVYLLGTVVIAVFVIGGCNALNLIDGLDGLAAGVAAIACVGFLIIATMIAVGPLVNAEGQPLPHVFSDPVRIVMCLAILGALLGFLPFNFTPHRSSWATPVRCWSAISASRPSCSSP